MNPQPVELDHRVWFCGAGALLDRPGRRHTKGDHAQQALTVEQPVGELDGWRAVQVVVGHHRVRCQALGDWFNLHPLNPRSGLPVRGGAGLKTSDLMRQHAPGMSHSAKDGAAGED